jgi:hypothetical protein
MDRAPLPVRQLDPRAWAVLRWRQDHLPLGRLRRGSDREALSHLEQAAAWRLGQRLDIDDDQRYSLLRQHAGAVERLVADRRPDLAGRVMARGDPVRMLFRARGRRRAFGHVAASWSVWFRNRQVGLRDRWFWLRTTPHYRGAPRA